MWVQARGWSKRRALKRCFKVLGELQKNLFDGYLRSDFIAKQLRYTKKLFNTRRRYLLAISHARKVFHADIAPVLVIEHLSQILYSLHQLRYRVEDYTTFSVCKRELLALESTSLAVLYTRSKEDRLAQLERFLDAIHEFEGIYNKALQIVARDPIVFLFFIQDLYALHETLSTVTTNE